MHILINPYGFWENTMNYQGLEGLAFTFVPLSTSTHPLWCTCVLGPGTTTCTYLSPVSHNTPACLSVQCLVRQQEAGCVCESQPRHTKQPEPLTEYTVQLRCHWRWLWSALKCCSSANFHLQIWHFARPPAFLPGYVLLLLQPDSFNYEFLCLLYPLNCLVSYLSC